MRAQWPFTRPSKWKRWRFGQSAARTRDISRYGRTAPIILPCVGKIRLSFSGTQSGTQPLAKSTFTIPALLSAQELAAFARRSVRSLTELAEYGLTLEELETSFIRWLDSQGWLPISFGADFAAFANQSGVTVVTERIQTRAGRSGIRITARRLQAKIWIELRMGSGLGEYRPTIEAVRFETASRAVEFRLSVDRIELLQPASIRAAVYEPDPRLTRPSSPPPDARRLLRARLLWRYRRQSTCRPVRT